VKSRSACVFIIFLQVLEIFRADTGTLFNVKKVPLSPLLWIHIRIRIQMDPHHFGNLDPHPDSHPHQYKNQDPDPYQFADDKPKRMEYEPI